MGSQTSKIFAPKIMFKKLIYFLFSVIAFQNIYCITKSIRISIIVKKVKIKQSQFYVCRFLVVHSSKSAQFCEINIDNKHKKTLHGSWVESGERLLSTKLLDFHSIPF